MYLCNVNNKQEVKHLKVFNYVIISLSDGPDNIFVKYELSDVRTYLFNASSSNSKCDKNQPVFK